MLSQDRDLVIIGAGPAGAAAAIEAAKANLNVAVYDKAYFPRDKCCGDGLTTTALRHLEQLGLERQLIPSWQPVNQISLIAPSAKAYDYSFGNPTGLYGAVAKRKELDHALVNRARQAGATVRQGWSLDKILKTSTDIVSLQMIDPEGQPRRVNSPLVIAADGMWSPTRKLLERPPAGSYRGEWHALRQYFNYQQDLPNRLLVKFHPQILPGYLWSFPLADGTSNVGFGIWRSPKHPVSEMGRIWPDLLADLLPPGAIAEGPRKAWPIPARLGRRSLSNGRFVFVGDAAAAADPLTGEGIGQALESGRLIIRCLTSANGDISAAIAAYKKTLTKGMIRDHSLAYRLSRTLSNQRLAETALTLTKTSDWTARNFARWLFEDYPRAFFLTPSRWQRGALSSPGAWV